MGCNEKGALNTYGETPRRVLSLVLLSHLSPRLARLSSLAWLGPLRRGQKSER